MSNRKLNKNNVADRRKYEGACGHVKGILAINLKLRDREIKRARRLEARPKMSRVVDTFDISVLDDARMKDVFGGSAETIKKMVFGSMEKPK